MWLFRWIMTLGILAFVVSHSGALVDAAMSGDEPSYHPGQLQSVLQEANQGLKKAGQALSGD